MNADESAAAFWNGVFATAEWLDHTQAAIPDVVGCLRGLVEGSAGKFDPADCFPEYAALALARSLCAALDRHLKMTEPRLADLEPDTSAMAPPYRRPSI